MTQSLQMEIQIAKDQLIKLKNSSSNPFIIQLIQERLRGDISKWESKINEKADEKSTMCTASSRVMGSFGSLVDRFKRFKNRNYCPISTILAKNTGKKTERSGVI